MKYASAVAIMATAIIAGCSASVPEVKLVVAPAAEIVQPPIPLECRASEAYKRTLTIKRIAREPDGSASVVSLAQYSNAQRAALKKRRAIAAVCECKMISISRNPEDLARVAGKCPELAKAKK